MPRKIRALNRRCLSGSRSAVYVAALIGWAGPAAAQVMMELDAPDARQGTVSTASLQISSDVPLAGFNAEIQFPAGVTVGAVSLGSLLTDNGSFQLTQQINGQTLRVMAWSGRNTWQGSGIALRVPLTLAPDLLGLQAITFAQVNPDAQINSRHAVSNPDGSESLDHQAADHTFLAYSVTSDFDGDGLPDEWEVDNGLDPLTDNTGLDSDGDGFTDAEEFAAGTHPNDPQDFPVCFGPDFVFCNSFEE